MALPGQTIFIREIVFLNSKFVMDSRVISAVGIAGSGRRWSEPPTPPLGEYPGLLARESKRPGFVASYANLAARLLMLMGD
jgi:hypothetical protein